MRLKKNAPWWTGRGHEGNDVDDYFFSSEIIHSSRQAPMMEVTRAPTNVPPQLIPSQARRLPPIKPPTIPIKRLTMKPKPEPFISLPARKPANAPMTILTMILVEVIMMGF